MNPKNLTNLDFYEVKESIKSYLKTKDEFSDYNFEGSTISYLLDTLAYNTYYSSFYANLTANELFLETSTIRDNIIKIAKLLNYTPRSRRASELVVSFAFECPLGPDGTYPTTVELQPGPVFSSSVQAGQGFVFNKQDKITSPVSSTTGRVAFNSVALKEGNILNYAWTVDTSSANRYIIPNKDIDTSTLKVKVKSSAQSTQSDLYKLARNLDSIGPGQKVFFLQESEDQRYEIYFGDGKTGRQLIDGEVIEVEYLTTKGPEANGCQKLTFVGSVIDSFGRPVTFTPVVKLISRAQGGEEQETIEQIRFNAPRFAATQSRAVTKTDYESLVRIVYPQTASVKAIGGESLNPPEYGKVFITIKNKSGTDINALTKRRIKNALLEYAVASVDIEILDAVRTFADVRILVKYDRNSTNLSQQSIYNLIEAALKRYDRNNFNNFGGQLSYSKLIGVLDNADPSITSVLLNVRLRQRICPNFGNNTVYNLNFGVPLEKGSTGTNNGDGNGGNGGGDGSCACDETNVLSSGFKIVGFDRNLELDDDSKGNIRLYYIDNGQRVYINNSIGKIDYDNGKLSIGPINIVSTSNPGPCGLLISVKPTNPTVRFPYNTIPEIGFPTVIDVYDDSNTFTPSDDWTPPPLTGGNQGGTTDGSGGSGGSSTTGGTGTGTGGTGSGGTGSGGTGSGDGSGGSGGSGGTGGSGGAGGGTGDGSTGTGSGNFGDGTGLTNVDPGAIGDDFFESTIDLDEFTNTETDSCF